MNSAFPIVQIFYWLALATWFGGVMFVMIAAPVIFRIIRESDPTLPTVLSVNLEGQHATLLAGSVVANLLASLLRIQIICAAVLLVTLIAQWWLLPSGQHGPLIVRAALYVVATVLMIFDWRVVSPRIFKYRQQYIDNADEPDKANPAKEQFDHYHRESITILMIELCSLLGLVIFSAGIAVSTATTYLFGS